MPDCPTPPDPDFAARVPVIQGIIRRRVSPARSVRTSALISSALVIPFIVLESINRRGFHEGFPIALFGLLWLLPFSFALISTPIIRGISARSNGRVARRLLPKAVLLIFIAWLWVSITADQMPCFLGVPNCD